MYGIPTVASIFESASHTHFSLSGDTRYRAFAPLQIYVADPVSCPPAGLTHTSNSAILVYTRLARALQIYVADLYDQLSADTSAMKDIMKEMYYSVDPNGTLEDFIAQVRINERAQVIDDMNLRLAYQKVWTATCAGAHLVAFRRRGCGALMSQWLLSHWLV